MVTTEYLILNEDNIDWDDLSSQHIFSLPEIRLFRSKINWKTYLKLHADLMSLDMLEIASKYFTNSIYKLLALQGSCPEEFVLNHKNDFGVYGIQYYILKAKPSENFLIETLDYWEKDTDICNYVKSNIDSKKCPRLSLLIAVE